MSKVRRMTYTKANGDISKRSVLVISAPKKNYLMYDVSNMSDDALDVLVDSLNKAEEFRDNAMADFELITGIKQASLWRSFKPEGIEWEVEDEI